MAGDPFAKFRTGAPAETTQRPVAVDEQISDPFAKFRIQPQEEFRPSNTLGEEFGAGLGSGTQGFQATLYGLAGMVGRETGITPLEEWGKRGAEENFGDIERWGRESGGFGEIESAGGFFKWASASLGEAIPSLGTAIAGGGLGGIAAKKAVEMKLRSTLSNRIARTLTRKGYTPVEARAASARLIRSEQGEQFLKDAVFRGKSSQELMRSAFTRGQTRGAVAASALPQIGATDLELQEAGIDAGFTAIIAGTVAGALEALPALRLMDKMFPGVDRELSRAFVKDFAVATGQQALIEGGTEGAQEIIQMAALAYHDPSFDMFSPEARQRVIDAAAAGALVGAVTGGGAKGVEQGTIALREGAAKLPDIPNIPKFTFRQPDQEVYPEGFEPADNTFFQEIKDRMYATVGPSVEAAVNSARDKIAPVIDAINVEINPGMNQEGKRLFDVLREGHEKFIETHKADIERIKTHINERAARVYEAAKSINDPEAREAYIKSELDGLRETMKGYLERLRRAAQARDQKTEAEVDNMDFDEDMLGEMGYQLDDEGNVVDPNTFEPSVQQDVMDEEETRVGPSGRKFTRKVGPAPTQTAEQSVDRSDPEVGQPEPGPTAVFGNYLGRPKIDVSGKETVRGYPDEEKAQAGVERLMEELPESADGDFDIVKQDDGTFRIEVRNPELKEDIMFNEQIRKANRSANKNKKTGNYKVSEDKWMQDPRQGSLKGFKAPSLNLMTLAWEGMNLLDNRDDAGLFEGFQASLAKMLDRGMIDGETANEMLDQFRQENPQLIDTLDPDRIQFAPVSKYPTKGVAQAIMINLSKRIAEQFDVRYGWPKNMIDVRQNADGTYSWGITNPAMFKRLRAKNPEQAKAILQGIKEIRREEKLNKQKIGPGGRDIGVSADPRGRFAGDPDAPVVGTTTIQEGEGNLGPTSTGPQQDFADVTGQQGFTQRGDNIQRTVKVTQETTESIQEADRITNPDNLESEMDVQDVMDDTKFRRTRGADIKRNQRTQSAEDNRLLKQLHARPGKVKVMMTQKTKAAQKTREAVRSITNFVRNTLGLNNEVIVMDDSGLRYMIENNLVSDPVFEETLNNPKVNARNIRLGNVSYVYMSDAVAGDPKLAVVALGHELGHHLHRVAWDNLSEKGQQDLRKASKTKTDAEFDEWMADQLAAWMTKKALPRNAVEKFFFTVGKKVKQLYDFIAQNKRFQLNETYAEFVDAVARKARGEADSRGLGAEKVKYWFKNEGVTMYKWWGGLPSKDNMDVPYAGRQISQATETAMERFKKNYPDMAKRAVTIRNWMINAYKMALAPSTSVVRNIGKRIPVANEVVSIFGREKHGEAKKSSNYHQRVNLMKGQFLEKQFGKTRSKVEAEVKKRNPDLKGAKLQGAVNVEMRRIARNLRKKEGNPRAEFTPLEQEIRTLFDDMHAYAREAGLPVKKITNYFPRQFSREKLLADQEKILRFLDEQLGSREKSRAFFNSLIDPSALDGRATAEAIETPGFKNMNSRTARHEFFDAYLDDNMDGIIANYVNAVVKRSEFNRFLGEPMPPTDITAQEAIKQGLWDPKGQYHRLLRQAKKEGATDEELQQIEKYIDANLGQLGRDDISPGLRKWMAGVMAYQNTRVLLFTVLASLPDMAGPAIRAGDMKLAFNAARKHIHEMATNENALAEMARAYGIISSAANDHIMTEYVDNHYMPPKMRKWNDAYFKYTGLNWYTDFTRKYALQVGVDYLETTYNKWKNPANEKEKFQAQNALEELGITDPNDVKQWLADGKRTIYSLNEGGAYQTRIAEALVQFVDESIMRPNAAQRPILASHPGAMLVFHLKGYLYAVHEVVLKRLKYNIDEAQTPAQYAAAIAPALAMMALTAIGLEIRELIQYAGSNRKPPTDRMDGWEYTFELLQRSGLTGIPQLAIDFDGAEDRGMSEIAGIGGPTLAQFADIISKPSTQTIPKAIPVVGQFPAGRDAVRTVL